MYKDLHVRDITPTSLHACPLTMWAHGLVCLILPCSGYIHGLELNHTPRKIKFIVPLHGGQRLGYAAVLLALLCRKMWAPLRSLILGLGVKKILMR